MKISARTLTKSSLIVAVLGVISTATIAIADPPRLGCWRNINCLDVWDPVICSNGLIYSNGCYAYRACATGCVPYGGDVK